MSRIDAHQHVWRLSRGDYGWLTPALGPIYRDFTPDDLAPHLAAHDIAATILVQAAPTAAETAFLLDIARTTDFVAGVVGWTDFDAPDAPAAIAGLAANPLLVGLRPMVQDIADDDWLARAALASAFDAIVAQNLVFDALLKPRHLPRLIAALDRHPQLAVVIDHGAKPAIGGDDDDAWRAGIAAAARYPNVACKLSGLVTEAPAHWQIDDLRPYVEYLLTCFGPQRLIWGSDWPVVTLAADYGRWVAAAEHLMAPLDDEARAAVFGGNARRIYLAHRGKPIAC
ncbi:amidohydrolase family protein [Bradyrhizobium sp. U87765 SZCCT0131]|uniref:amidohydrolase family protein n=1 Tax=unclassified Bradyrhizobium TaxID=2631580 RepID=UPI001BAB67BA|nr:MULTISPECIES: amidohydrolase family protein [unclassified Bradyrhizobium]MBR1221960.1 amidohydrolase family protein [Bradyrhizobium sp. U87765 SZCCT0131]MBR1263842.1 amidohydrolase family protein [Bradyrhizobium sp. U87765 SZCCT0134]MBR1302588.1 amidohydrolase family protein [Bradyrhizobium sp. U87765 SZCCT0110]MBR1320092.1 amidohydrolase family protein [Bradyrhizobium sp. U87765 SZCCT0109]MBR1348795.1 amidohydrolase family protein [Bradyrhizobium sp. U87765 SZCCT0048]